MDSMTGHYELELRAPVTYSLHKEQVAFRLASIIFIGVASYGALGARAPRLPVIIF